MSLGESIVWFVLKRGFGLKFKHHQTVKVQNKKLGKLILRACRFLVSKRILNNKLYIQSELPRDYNNFKTMSFNQLNIYDVKFK